MLAGPVGGAPPRVSLRLKARLAGGCGGATLDVTGEPYGRAGGGLPLAACEQGHLSLSLSLCTVLELDLSRWAPPSFGCVSLASSGTAKNKTMAESHVGRPQSWPKATDHGRAAWRDA